MRYSVNISASGVPSPSALKIGKIGENNVVYIDFDVTEWHNTLGDGQVTGVFKRANESDAYPVYLSKDGNVATLIISDTETSLKGLCQFEIHYVGVTGEFLAKSDALVMNVVNSISAIGDVPDPYKSFLDKLVELAAKTLENAEQCQEYVEEARSIYVATVEYVENKKSQIDGSVAQSMEYANNSKSSADRSELAYENIVSTINELGLVFGSHLTVTMDDNYIIHFYLKNKNGDVIDEEVIDLPIESLVVNASYNNTTKDLTFTLKNGSTLTVPLDDLINGLAKQSDVDAHVNDNNIHVTSNLKYNWNRASDLIENHIVDYGNPHQVTAEQLGLGNVNSRLDSLDTSVESLHAEVETNTDDIETLQAIGIVNVNGILNIKFEEV